MEEREEDAVAVVVRQVVQKLSESNGGYSICEVLSAIKGIIQDITDQGSTRRADDKVPLLMHADPTSENIWKRLVRVPQISVGFEGCFNHLTLAEIKTTDDANPIRVYHVGGENSLNSTSSASKEHPLVIPEYSTKSIRGPSRQSSSSTHSAEESVSDSQVPPRRRGFRENIRSEFTADMTPSKAALRKKAPRAEAPRTIKARRYQQPNGPRRVGGTRKYLRGLEGFWNEHFWHARNQCEGLITPRFNAGIATHPAAKALYANRPAGIDEVILGAIEAGLPIPAEPQDLTRSWTNMTSWVLNRSQQGVYVSPPGIQRVDSSQYADHSGMPTRQIFILRSDRLGEVELSEKNYQGSFALFSLTLAAHTCRRQGFFSVCPTSSTGKFGPCPPGLNTELNDTYLISPAPKIGLTRGPRLGVFRHDDASLMCLSTEPEPTRENSTTSARPERRRRSSIAAEGASGSDSLSRATTVSLESPAGYEEMQDTASWRGLPPPLTTRGRKRKLSSKAQVAGPSIKRQKAHPKKKNRPTQLSSLATTATETTPPTTNDLVDVNASTTALAVSEASLAKGTRPPKVQSPASKISQESTRDLIKQILLEVIQQCGGMVPFELLSISNYMNQKWRARGKSGQPDRKRCKNAIKNLCASGKIKKLTFTFQRKTGVIGTGSILTSSEVDATSDAVKRLQQNIINASPDLYVPPLGSVLNAPTIEASPHDAPTMTLRAEKPQLEKYPAGAATKRRSRTKNSARKDILGATVSRRPFTWQGPPNNMPVNDAEELLGLAYVYLAASECQSGQSRWINAEVRTAEEDQIPGKRRTSMPQSRLNNRTRKQLTLDSPEVIRPQTRLGTPKRRTPRPTASLKQASVPDDLLALESPPSNAMSKFGRSSRGRKIIWKKRESEVLPPALPSSLQDIIDMPGQIPAIDYSMTEDPETNFFYWELDAVEYWEGHILKIFQQQATEWTFINHMSRDRNLSCVEGSTSLQWEQPEVLLEAIFTPRPRSMKGARPTLGSEPLDLATEPTDNGSVDSEYASDFDGNIEAPVRKRTKISSVRPPRRPRDGPKRMYTRRPVRPIREDGAPWERQSRSRILNSMSSEEIYRIVLAVIVVRTLVGGITGEIDWSIVRNLCPNRNEDFLMQRWDTLLIRNRQDIKTLSTSLQEKYISAFEKGEVPGVDFENIPNSDWEGIVSWAEQNLDKNISENSGVLPSTRAELLQKQTYTFDEPQNLRDSLAYTSQSSNSLKAAILAGTPAAVPLDAPSIGTIGFSAEAEVEEKDLNISRAKSWAMSTVLTPDDALDTSAITKKLSTISPNKKDAEEVFDKALKILQRKLMIKRDRVTKLGGVLQAGWKPSERWVEMFSTKRMITGDMLKKAASWKRDVMDVASARGKSVDIQKTQVVKDGEMVALVNMVANGRCKITAGPAGLPRGRYGLDPDATSYNTKGMGRIRTLFATTVRPVQGRYVPGDPMGSDRLAIPTWQEGGQGNIPCWVDMNGNLLQDIWEMVVGATVGLLSGRPGLQAVEIERSLGHGLTGWEVQTMLLWLLDSGFVQRTEHGSGWKTKEWWWMVCGYAS